MFVPFTFMHIIILSSLRCRYLEHFGALFIEAAKSPFSNPFLNGGCPYNTVAFSLIEKAAFEQIEPKICQQVQGSEMLQTKPNKAAHHLHTQPTKNTHRRLHHSRALDSPLDLAILRTAVSV